MKRAAVIGHPINHSKSPIIHGYWLKKHGIEGAYEAIDVSHEKLEHELLRLADEGYAGFNVTLPYKEAVYAHCDVLDETAKDIGAVNTVVIKKGKLHGTNTDVFGFIENIKTSQPDFDFKAGPALVLGAGGAARAVIYGLLKSGVPEVRISNRTRDKSQMLARDFKNLRVVDWEKREDIQADTHLLVNATSMGMNGQPKLEMNLSRLPAHALVNDIVYTPLQTDLLRGAAERGNKTVTGIGMLLHQARPGFKAWFGIMPEVDSTLEQLVLG